MGAGYPPEGPVTAPGPRYPKTIVHFDDELIASSSHDKTDHFLSESPRQEDRSNIPNRFLTMSQFTLLGKQLSGILLFFTTHGKREKFRRYSQARAVQT